MTGIDRETRRRRGALGVVIAAMLAVFALAVAPQAAAQDKPPDNNAPITLEVTRDSERAALTWTRGGDPAEPSGCPTSHYLVRAFYYDDSGEAVDLVNTLIKHPASSYELTGLTPKTDYAVQINPYSDDCKSYSSESGVAYFKTKKAKKNEPATQIAGTESDTDDSQNDDTGDGDDGNDGGSGNNDSDNTNDDSDESNADSDDTGNSPGNIDGDGGVPGDLGDDDDDSDQPDGEENDIIQQPTAPLSPVIAFSASFRHACALHADGSLRCWGGNRDGQAEPPAGTFKAITTGGESYNRASHQPSHSCAIRTDDSVVCWGNNDYWQSEEYGRIIKFKAISAGGGFNCGITAADRVACWGLNDKGQTIGPSGTFKAIDAGVTHTCAIRADDTIACWGGDEDWRGRSTGQTNPPSGTFKAVSAGGDHTCALRMDGSIVCWGSDVYGRSSPPEGAGFKAISAGFWATCAIRGDDTVACWGWNSFALAGTFKSIDFAENYICGIPTDERIDAGTLVCSGDDHYKRPEPLSYRYRSISGGWTQSCGVRGNRTIECWGRYSSHGQLSPPEGTFKTKQHHIAAGEDFACAIRQGGDLACWGANDFGKSTPPQGKFMAVTAGEDFACAIRKNDNAIACWGHDGSYGYTNSPRGEFTAIDAGRTHTCAIRTNGKIACWGDWGHGRTDPPKGQFKGLGISEYRSCAIRLDNTIECWATWGNWANPPSGHQTPTGEFTAITAGWHHLCAIRADGDAVCWGDNHRGESSPPGGTQFIALGAGNGHTCGIIDNNGRKTGEVVCFSRVYRPDSINWVKPGGATTDG